MTAEELSAMWRELRPQIGNFMCRLDSEVRFIQDRHDTYVTKEEHERKCDECYDAGIDIGRHSCEIKYIYAIHQLDKMKEDELVELFGTDCPLDVLKMNGINEILDKICDHVVQAAAEIKRELAKRELDEWYKSHLEEIKQAEAPLADELEKLAIKRTFLEAQFKERKRALGMEDGE